MLTGIYTPEEVNAVLELIIQFSILVFATSVGTFTREMIYPDENTFSQSIGLLLLSAVIAFAVTIKFNEEITIAYTFLICVASGFFVPAFKDWLKGKTLFQLLLRILKGMKNATDSAVDELDKKLEDDENDNS